MLKGFDEYYQYYLSLHQDKRCRRVHVLGQLVTITFVFACFINSWWVYLLFTPFIIYPFAWFGHFFFENNKPLAWGGVRDYGRTTLKAKLCDLIMLKDWVLGKIER